MSPKTFNNFCTQIEQIMHNFSDNELSFINMICFRDEISSLINCINLLQSEKLTNIERQKMIDVNHKFNEINEITELKKKGIDKQYAPTRARSSNNGYGCDNFNNCAYYGNSGESYQSNSQSLHGSL
jgi:hypothetical protein